VPNESILDLIVVAVREPITQPDDPVHIGDFRGRVRIDSPQPGQRLADDLQVALDRLPHLSPLEVRLERCTRSILGYVSARSRHVVKQLRRFGMHRK
jgi:hypothetical protein